MIFGIYKNDERARYLDFIEPPFMTDPVSIVVRKGDAVLPSPNGATSRAAKA